MKYLSQRNAYSCSIYAVMNALIHINTSVDEKKLYLQLSKILKVKKNIGSLPKDFDKGIKKVLPWVVKKKNPKLKDIQVPAIIGIDYMDNAHIGLIIKKTKTHVYLINWHGKSTIRKVSIKKMEMWMSEWCVAYEF